MKFAKYQANNLIPEWRLKYLDYKKGKKLLKDVKKARARRQQQYSIPASLDGHEADSEDGPASPRSPTYGAIQHGTSPHSIKSTKSNKSTKSPTESGGATAVGDGLQVGSPINRPPSGSDDSTTPIVPSSKGGLRSRATAPSSDVPKLQQVIDSLRRTRRGSRSREQMFVKDDNFEFDESEITFLHWLDGEIKKVDDFYQEKEHEAVNRYNILAQQLEALKRLRDNHGIPSSLPNSGDQSRGGSVSGAVGALEDAFVMAWGKPVQRIRASWDGLHSAMPAADHQRRARQNPDLMAHPIGTAAGYAEYRVARRRLKQAVLEFYRAMELLKQYRLLNRTGLAKILKKFDKTSGRHLTPEYDQKINTMYFNQSEVLETTMSQTEDLFAKFFERNNRKHAVERLRSQDKRNDHVPAVFHVGFLLGLSIPFLLEGLVNAQEAVNSGSIPQTTYLLQVWGGIGLVILFLLLFGLNCWAWTVAKINYTFIFEFDTKHHLDYRQFLELPSLLAFLGCVCFWLTFQNFWPEQLYATWYPLIWLCLCIVILLFPLRTLHRSSRSWFAIANFRILFSGLFPVEFRDFFLGDQYNSLIYSFANVPLFFCLYAKDWDPLSSTQCNSSHSRVLGFCSTLPPIWRFCQCLRRYTDTRNAFPHLVNAGKYSATILMYTMLSLWRIGDTDTYMALFILFASINTLYCSWWDLFMDWSLMQPHAPHPFLRQDLGYKKYYLYYVAMFLDPVMRSSWIFYCAFPGQKQHSAATSFFIALGEIFRRFMWNFFRVENEHMTNVGHFMASRDVPLPFALDTAGTSSLEAQPTQPRASISIRAMGTMKRGMVKMTSKLRVKHAEDFSRRPGPEKGPPKGRMPDETEFSSDLEMLEERDGEDENEGVGPRNESVGGRPMTLHEMSQLAHE